MWRLLRTLVLLLALPLWAAAQSSGPAVTIRSGTADPASCNPSGPNIIFRTDTGAVKVCTATNTWTAIGGGGGTPGGSNTQVQYNNAGAFGGIPGATTDGTTLTLVAPILGTPASGTLTNATGLPISTGVSGLGAGVATFLATPSSANLAAALTDETGTVRSVFSTAPVFDSTITIGTAAGTTGAALFKGTTSGTVTLTVAAAAGTHSLTLPTAAPGANSSPILVSTAGLMSYPTGTPDGTKFLRDDGAWAAVSAGANTALSNLASVAINTTLVSDTDNTDDLGTSSISFRTAYLGTSLFTPQIYGSAAANGDVVIEGTSSATKTSSAVDIQPTGGQTNIGRVVVGNTRNAIDFGPSTGQPGTGGYGNPAAGNANSTGDKLVFYRSTYNVAMGMDGNTQLWFQGLDDAATGGFGFWTGNTPTLKAVIDGQGALLANRRITAKTSDYTIVAANRDTVFNNAGAGGTVILTLPTAAAGLPYSACRVANFTLKLTAGASTTIRIGDSVTAAAGSISLDTVGACVNLVAHSTTEWYALSFTGTISFP